MGGSFPAQKTFYSQKFLLTNKAHNASFTQGTTRERKCGTEGWKTWKVSIIISNSTTNSKNQIWELVRNIVHTPCSMQLTLANLSHSPFFLSVSPCIFLLPLSIRWKVCSSLGQHRMEYEFLVERTKKRCGKRRKWRRIRGTAGVAVWRVRDMEKLLWFYWNQSMGVAYITLLLLCLDHPLLRTIWNNKNSFINHENDKERKTLHKTSRENKVKVERWKMQETCPRCRSPLPTESKLEPEINGNNRKCLRSTAKVSFYQQKAYMNFHFD